MASKRCPSCGLVNPGSAMTCDCGRSFVDGSHGAPLDLSKPGAPIAPVARDTTPIVVRIVIALIVAGVVVAIKVMIRRA